MDEETKPNEEQPTPEADQPETATPEENTAPAEDTPEVPAEDPAKEEVPAEEPTLPAPPTPAPAPANAPAQPAVVPSAQNAVDVMKAPAATSENIASQLTEDALKQKAFFESQPKVIMNIPLKEGEKRGAYESVNVNGYRLQIPKGVSVKLPMGVADILAEHYNIQLGTGAIPEEASVSADRDELR